MEKIIKEIEELKKRVAALEVQVQAQQKDVITPLSVSGSEFVEHLSQELASTIVDGTVSELP